MSRVSPTPRCALFAAAMLALLVLPIASAEAQAKGSANLRKQVRALKQEINELRQHDGELQRRIEELSTQQGPPQPGPQGPAGAPGPVGPQGPATGPAGGALTGTFPNPLIAANAVGGREIEDNAIGDTEISTAAVGSDEVADGSIFGPDIGADSVGTSEISSGGVGALELTETIAVVGDGVEVFAGGGPRDAVVSCPESHRRLIAGGYAWSKDEPNSIIYSAPDEFLPFNRWVVRGVPDAGGNTLYAWATCLAV